MGSAWLEAGRTCTSVSINRYHRVFVRAARRREVVARVQGLAILARKLLNWPVNCQDDDGAKKLE